MGRKPIAFLAAAVLAAGLLAPPAAAQGANCLLPDHEAPLIHDFRFGPGFMPRFDPIEPPAEPERLGTRFEVKIWDTVNPGGSNSNLIEDARFEILEAGIDDRMEPEDGRWMRARLRAAYVLEPGALAPGPYTVRIRAWDSCGNEAVRTWRIFQATFLVTASCEGFVYRHCLDD